MPELTFGFSLTSDMSCLAELDCLRRSLEGASQPFTKACTYRCSFFVVHSSPELTFGFSLTSDISCLAELDCLRRSLEGASQPFTRVCTYRCSFFVSPPSLECLHSAREVKQKRPPAALVTLVKVVGVSGFEPPASRPPDVYSNLAELHPVYVRFEILDLRSENVSHLIAHIPHLKPVWVILDSNQ